MKIGLVTIVDKGNYGNRLQNFAIQQIMEKYGHQVETIRKIQDRKTVSEIIKYYLKKVTGIKYTRNVKREASFEAFNIKNIKFSHSFIRTDGLDDKLSKKYDIFICGSDQLWNPEFKTNTDSYFLSFVSEKRKVSLAASFGIDKIENEDAKKRIGALIQGLDAISVREQSGKQIVESLSSKEATVLIDPTMMLDGNEWKRIEKKPRNIGEKKYILCYFLGIHSQDIIEKIKKYGSEKDLNVVFMENQYFRCKITSEEEFSYGPDEFIWLIRNAEKVITDSFHAMIFSLLFKKKFLVMPRDVKKVDMSSRFNNVEELFKIKNYMYNDEDSLDKCAIVDYMFLKKTLCYERNKFLKFIENNIAI